MKHCAKCQQDWPEEEFTKSGGYCRSCRAQYQRERCAAIKDGTWEHRQTLTEEEKKARREARIRRWRQAHPDNVKAHSRRYREAHPDRVRAYKAKRKASGAERAYNTEFKKSWRLKKKCGL